MMGMWGKKSLAGLAVVGNCVLRWFGSLVWTIVHFFGLVLHYGAWSVVMGGLVGVGHSWFDMGYLVVWLA